MANPYFNAVAYLQKNPDVMAAGYTVDNAEQHYLQYGANEALLGNAARNPAPYFDVAYYLNTNPDLIAAGIGADGAFAHFVQYGQFEGRSPKSGLSITDEALSAYAEANPDLQEAFGIEDPADLTEEQQDALTSHFYQYGYAEDRPGAPFDVDTNPGKSFTLTTGADMVEGTTGDDIITALSIDAAGANATTLSAFDSIDGGDGVDTLNIYTTKNHNNDLPATATVKNVEIVNIYNANKNNPADLGNAANYEGVEQLWQFGSSTAVTNLAETTVAGFGNLVAAAGDARRLDVTAATDATSAAIALDNVQGGIWNIAGLDVQGNALTSVTVTGELVPNTDPAANEEDPYLELEVQVGKNVQSLTLSTEVKTDLEVLANGKAVTTVDASASTGDIAYDAADTVTSITTGSGDDFVELNTKFGGTVKTATVATGEGDDIIIIDTTGTGAVTVDAGAGDDIVLTEAIRGTSTKSSIDGGEGTDTLVTDGGTLIAEDYTLLNNVFTNFEELVFTDVSEFDASRLADYKSFTLELGSTVAGITKLADDQAVETVANLTATANGYKAGATTEYAGTLNITVTDDDDDANATITANAEAITLSVVAGEDDGESYDAFAALAGDVKEASITVTNNLDDDNDGVASVLVATANGGSLKALTSVTFDGDGAASVINDANTALVSIDASGLTGADTNGDDVIDTGLLYISSNAKAETITLGAGHDTLTINASSVLATDSITNFTLVATSTGDLDGAASDSLTIGTWNDFSALGEVEAANLALALVDVVGETGSDTGLVFDFGGDTYAYVDSNADGAVTDTDVLVKLVGGVDQDLLIDTLNMVLAP